MPRGAILSMHQTWALAKLWYRDRLDPAFRRRTPAEANDAFASIGLSGEFWEF
jgi:hypothetical protein